MSNLPHTEMERGVRERGDESGGEGERKGGVYDERTMYAVLVHDWLPTGASMRASGDRAFANDVHVCVAGIAR